MGFKSNEFYIFSASLFTEKSTGNKYLQCLTQEKTEEN